MFVGHSQRNTSGQGPYGDHGEDNNQQPPTSSRQDALPDVLLPPPQISYSDWCTGPSPPATPPSRKGRGPPRSNKPNSKSPRKGLQDQAMLRSTRLRVCFMFGVDWLVYGLNRAMYGRPPRHIVVGEPRIDRGLCSSEFDEHMQATLCELASVCRKRSKCRLRS